VTGEKEGGKNEGIKKEKQETWASAQEKEKKNLSCFILFSF
jgi:hypothetical protein